MWRLVLFALLTALMSSRAQAQSSLDTAPPVPPDTEDEVAPPKRLPAAVPERAPPEAERAPNKPTQPSAAERYEADKPTPEPIMPGPGPTASPAPGAIDNNPYPSEPAPEFGTQPKPPPDTSHIAPPSAAAEPITPVPKLKPIRLAAMVGVGVTFDRTLGSVNPLGFGFGLRGDYRVWDNFTVGARLLYYVGGSSELPTGSIEMQSWLFALEGAYAFELDPVLIQPGIALGIATRSTHGLPAFTNTGGQSFIPGSQDHTAVGLYLAPGVNVVVPLSALNRDLEMFFVGGDLRFDLVFGSSVSANLQLLAEAGLHF